MIGGRIYVAIVLLSSVLGCGDDGPSTTPMPDSSTDVSIDAPMSAPCWFDTYTPAGTIALGTGNDYVPMGDHVNLEYGSQNGFHIPVHARITGLAPGNPTDPLDEGNPRTRFHGFFVATGEPVNPGRCGIRLGYVPNGGAFDLARGSAILFDTALTGVDLFGIQVRVVVEIIDASGNYAIDEKVVTCDPPIGWSM